MSDKSNDSVLLHFVLPDMHPVALTGPDAARFAQAQFMNDVATLPAGHWHWNGWLTPKGRVIALFALLKRADDDVLLLLLDADPVAFCAALGRFVFRSKVKLNPAPGVQVTGSFIAPEKAQGCQIAELDEGRWELDFSGEGGARRVWLAVTPMSAPVDAVAQERWHEFDLVHGLPRLLPGQAERWTPQQLSLDRLNAYSVKKGCYPGQEIVARTHFLGQAKRGVVRLVACAPPPPNANVAVDAAAPVPLVASAGCQALAVLALDTPATARYVVHEREMVRQALVGGLGR